MKSSVEYGAIAVDTVLGLGEAGWGATVGTAKAIYKGDFKGVLDAQVGGAKKAARSVEKGATIAIKKTEDTAKKGYQETKKVTKKAAKEVDKAAKKVGNELKKLKFW